MESVICAFEAGCAAEVILRKYPSVGLADIERVIAYYLSRREEVQAYMEARRRVEIEVQQENAARFPSVGVRERLLARHAWTRSTRPHAEDTSDGEYDQR
ncbi:MAG: hypothetical protein HZA54_19705 [Planctomycetes bacterium]|nr:hypothetical protein [Planctomycetota bacterium]